MKTKNSFTASMNRQVFSLLWESLAPPCVVFTCEEKFLKVLMFLLFPSSYLLLSMMLCGMRYRRGQLKSGVSPSSLCFASPALLAFRTVWETEMALILCRYDIFFSNSSSMSVLPTPFLSQIQDMTPCELLWRKLTVLQAKPVHLHLTKDNWLFSVS